MSERLNKISGAGMHLLAIIMAIWLCLIAGLHAAEKPMPSLAELESVVGLSKTSDAFKKVLAAYGFSENPKRKDSWGSSFGVFFGVSNEKVRVGIRPPSDATTMPVYQGALPRRLKSRDPVVRILEKLGKPKQVTGDPKGYYEMTYAGLTVYAMNGELFEVWLYETVE